MPLFIGLMSGTSLDGIDAALVRCGEGRPALLAAKGIDMPETLRRQLLALCQARGIDFPALAAAETAFCRLQAEAVTGLLDDQGVAPDEIVAVGSHGQTIAHAPHGYETGGAPYTLQLDNPSLLAELTGCRVVADFRRRDLAAGGHAAPLAPAFHAALFGAEAEWRVVLNLGGFANITLLPPSGLESPVIGFDTGPANALLDDWYAHHQPGRFDPGGEWAASGEVDQALLERLLDDDFFRRLPPKSTGREHFHRDWLEARLTGQESPQDVQATLAELTAASVALGIEQALRHHSASGDISLIPCGGGAHNDDLLGRLERCLPRASLTRCERFGWSPDWLEASAFAWLAWRRMENLPGNLPTVTGAAGPRVLGGVYSA
ncbi:anhydro-N-acetylmuramic acid kinase [Modicisalibacter ilicicola DSM 19980]|uniref:Anhydro-N-acetylmuramic acid kinase n=1 Tax=Modicisalibacter ilicicola DSM 19980 TaxID=1121942 RepID=A0A1M5ANE3_9GAMM|nr:anhydro-N-acetylmuramic acid kinase [Halomonas ilicicola]SHF31779.1 anhydro-N-acetylmuramic acid kinase [Halomonas ilicicola DSM 19980]